MSESEDHIPPPPLPMSNATNAGKTSALEQGQNVPMGWKPTAAEPIPPVRCTGTVRNGPRKGERCGKWSLVGATVCLVHGGHLPNVRKHAQDVKDEARRRLLGLAPDAIDVFENIIFSENAAPQFKIAAAKEILDRGGIVKENADLKVEIEHTVSPTVMIEEKLKIIAERRAQAEAERLRLYGEEDAEIVDEDVPDDTEEVTEEGSP